MLLNQNTRELPSVFCALVIFSVVCFTVPANGAYAASLRSPKPPPTSKYVKDALDCAQKGDADCVRNLAKGLLRDDPKAACPLLAKGIGVDEKSAALVFEAMVEAGCPKIDELAVEFLSKAQDESRMAVFAAVARTKSPALLPFAAKIAEQGNGWEKEQLCIALGQMALPDALPLLLGAAKDSMFSVRTQAATALGFFKGKEVADTLCLLGKNDTNPGVRKAAALALKALKEWDTIPCLIAMLKDREPDPFFAAHEAIVAVVGMDLGTKAAIWEDWWKNGAKLPK